MDDLTVITPTHVQARWVLAEMDRMATWAKMVFNSTQLNSNFIYRAHLKQPGLTKVLYRLKAARMLKVTHTMLQLLMTGEAGAGPQLSLQAQEVKEPGDPKGQNNWKVQATCSRGSDPEHPEEPN